MYMYSRLHPSVQRRRFLHYSITHVLYTLMPPIYTDEYNNTTLRQQQTSLVEFPYVKKDVMQLS